MTETVAAPAPPASPRAGFFSPALLGFALLSLLAHAATFLIFQVSYPPRVTIPPPAPQVSLLSGITAEQKAALRWIDAEDPALATASTTATPPHLFDVKFHPSFEVSRTPPRTLPPENEAPQRPPSPLVLPWFTDAPGRPPGSPPKPVVTTATLEGNLATRSVKPFSPFTVHASEPLQPAKFLLAVNDRGTVRFTFLQRSSGNAVADAEAAARLAAASLSPAPEPLAWGMATIAWGDEVYGQRQETP